MLGKFLLGMLLAAAVIYGVLYIYKAKSHPIYKLQKLEQSGELPKLDRSDNIAGPDNDNNGIRDDVDNYIRKTFKDPKQRRAVEQVARSTQQKILVNHEDKEAVYKVNEQDNRAYNCIRVTYDIKNSILYNNIVYDIHSITFNTTKRSNQYLKYNHALDGHSWSLPRGDTCDE